MTKQEIFDRINEVIVDEKGRPIKMDDLFSASELDSLGTMIVLVTLDAEFGIFEGMTEDEAFSSFDPCTATMRELVQKCKSPSSTT